jgi:hypothetical protein
MDVNSSKTLRDGKDFQHKIWSESIQQFLSDNWRSIEILLLNSLDNR